MRIQVQIATVCDSKNSCNSFSIIHANYPFLNICLIIEDMISTKAIVFWSWEIFGLPFLTNQAIIYWHSNTFLLALSLVVISLLLPHLFLFTWHVSKRCYDIPDVATGKPIERHSNMSSLAQFNICFDVVVHFVLFLYIAKNYVITNNQQLKQEHLYSYTNFIFGFLVPLLFIEIVFDFFYYWWHYHGHKNRWVWKFIHSKHHEIKYPVYWDLYHNHFVDILVIRLIPFALYFVFSIATSKLSTMVLIEHYIILGELLGHAGFALDSIKNPTKDAGGSSRFLTTQLGITMTTLHHDYHHQKCGTNYSKRLILWDKLFGSYYEPKI